MGPDIYAIYILKGRFSRVQNFLNKNQFNLKSRLIPWGGWPNVQPEPGIRPSVAGCVAGWGRGSFPAFVRLNYERQRYDLKESLIYLPSVRSSVRPFDLIQTEPERFSRNPWGISKRGTRPESCEPFDDGSRNGAIQAESVREPDRNPAGIPASRST